jgi:hypothetical protein
MKNINHPSVTLPNVNFLTDRTAFVIGGCDFMKEILLSQQSKKNKGKYVALVDDEDYEYLNQFKWRAVKDYNTFYASRSIMVNGLRKDIKMHRLIMNVSDPKILIDHFYGNGINNQRYNLRICDNKQNQQNANPQTNNKSKYKGVSFNKIKNKWRARITVDKKTISLGYFREEREAAHVYNENCLKYFGSYANPNELWKLKGTSPKQIKK